MKKETYEKHLANYGSIYIKKPTSMFNGSFGLSQVMMVWDSIGTTNGYDSERGYRCDFLDKDGNVAGYTLSESGGIYWEYPQLIMDLWNYEKGVKIIKKYHLEPNSYLVSGVEGSKGVDCWFDNDTVRQHRCLSFEDYNTIRPNKKGA